MSNLKNNENQDKKEDNTNQISLENMSKNQIKTLLSKRIATKRKTISGATTLETNEYKLFEKDREKVRIILAKEKHIETKETILLSKKKDFSNILEIVKRVEDEDSKMKNSIKKNSIKKNDHTINDPQSSIVLPGGFKIDPSKSTITPQSTKPKGSQMPIIIIPNTANCIINSTNAQKFLEQGKFVAPEDYIKNGGSIPKFGFIQIVRTRKQTKLHYQLCDDPKKINKRDWDRVVCVITSGAASQLKNFRWKKPVEIFNEVRGIYFGYEDIKPPILVDSWKVKKLTISKNKRHHDTTAVYDFWKEIDIFIQTKKPFMKEYIK
ncbi:cdc73 domain protein [Anaeramoeba ignava]|uniref:Cdc73 domain protein n=1 Tax=Anaeramoeba ignava TaxID=1746090 RepID=A0A9Q0LQS6_ANAIG|nr:cdc73 domain protein [Anaeramoeba ignava]